MTADEARYERQNRLNPPMYPPGQEVTGGNGGNPMDSNMGDIFGSSSQPVNTQGMGDIFSSSVNGGLDMSGMGLTNVNGVNNVGGLGNNTLGASQNGVLPQQQAQQAPKTQEDILFETIGKILKGLVVGGRDMFVDLASSGQGLTILFWNKYSLRVLIAGLVAIVGGIILKVAGLGIGLEVSAGGAISAFIGVIVFGLTYESANNYTSMYSDENNTIRSSETPIITQASNHTNDTYGGSNGFFDSTSDGGNNDSWNTAWGSDDGMADDGIVYDDTEYEEEDDFDFNSVGIKGKDGMSAEDSLNNLQEVPHGMYTRQYLYEAFTRVLPTMRPDFNNVVEITDEEDAFYDWETKLRESAEVAGCKEENLPELLEVKITMSTIQLTCTRPVGFKSDAVAKEIATMYSYKDGEFDTRVYAKYDNLGKNCIITIFTGKSDMVSLKDMMLDVEDFILDTKNYMPVVFGINPSGKVIMADFKKLESIIITGMPRSGKSWFVQAVLTQMCFFVSPKELHIYICDPKEGISDFRDFTLPHVKKFVSNDNAIVNALRNIVKVEAPRRKKIIGDAGFVNIWDFKERHPSVDLPIIYIVIDEVVTLASRMDKDTFAEFRMLLRELISQLPALGIRAFMIPHILNNDIIEKKTSDLVPCKISVCGDADHIEKATGSKPKDFPYKLSNKGDMAIRMPLVNPDTMFVHGPALTDSNVKNSDYFDYMRQVWSKLEPDEVSNSVASQAEVAAQQKELLSKADSNIEIDIFGESDADYTSATDEFIRGILG